MDLILEYLLTLDGESLVVGVILAHLLDRILVLVVRKIRLPFL
jgi:hypothetical protein